MADEVDGVVGAEGEADGAVVERAAEEGAVDDGGAGGVDLGQKDVARGEIGLAAGAGPGALRRAWGDGEVRGERVAGDVGVALLIDGDAEGGIVPGAAEESAVNELGAEGVQLE